nr:cytochrome p450 [Colletotrichum truncatum]KAF6785340.1 cytochrome p450 [Colletotrichum truncatum]
MALSTNEAPRGLTRDVLRVCVLFLLLGVAISLTQLIQVRLKFRRLKKKGVPMLPHSLLFGHIPTLAKLTKGLPRDIHSNYVPQLICENWKTFFPDRKSCPPVIYIDSWPIAPPVIYIFDPETGAECLSNSSVSRSHNVLDFIEPITENLDMVSMEGEPWKEWRARFNPAFSIKNVTTLIPGMIYDVATFASIVRQHAGTGGDWGPVFVLQELTTNLTLDIIGRSTLGMELHEQTNGPSKLKAAFMDQMGWCMFNFNIIDTLKWYSPVRMWRVARNRSSMRKELYLPVTERLEIKGDDKLKTIVDQAIKPIKDTAYEEPPSIDSLFISTVMSQLKLFMFAGHDTTATTLCWVLHIIGKNPEIAAKVRAEHDEVLGKDITELSARLTESPHLLNSLPYTAGIIKEALRLYPAVGALRQGASHYQIVDRETGVKYPTDNCMLFDSSRSLSRADELWHRAKEAIPERWLTTDTEDPLYPPKNAWRRFGSGPRICIGQELAMTEMKLVVVFLAREFDIDCAWDKWDALKKANRAKGPC